MDEMFDAINTNASEAKAQQDAALAEWERQEAARKKAIARRADMKILLRAVAFAAFDGGLIAAVRAGMVDYVLAGVMLLLGFAWFGFHAGAWFQFRAREEDKLYG